MAEIFYQIQFSSQIESHKPFGDVVPEVAKRHHAQGITTTINEALVDADVSIEDIEASATGWTKLVRY